MIFDMTKRKGGEPAEYGLVDASYSTGSWSMTVANNMVSNLSVAPGLVRAAVFSKPFTLEDGDTVTISWKRTAGGSGNTGYYNSKLIVPLYGTLTLKDNFTLPLNTVVTQSVTNTYGYPITIEGAALIGRAGNMVDVAYRLGVAKNGDTLWTSIT